jgi:uncharacterized cupredoxin-like copper-binding protein
MRAAGPGRAVIAAALAAMPAWAAAAPVRIDVTLTEYAFTPSRLVFRHGVHYRLHLANAGKEFHEFTAPAFLKAIRIESPGVVNREGNQIDMPPGTQKDLDFVAPHSGRYRLWCADHDWAGMTGSIRVE